MHQAFSRPILPALLSLMVATGELFMVRFVLAVALGSWIGCGLSSAQAQLRGYFTGVDLTKACRGYVAFTRDNNRGTAQQAYDSAMCQGYVVGALDAIEAQDLEKAWLPHLCLPSQLAQNSATEIVANFLDRRPEQRHRLGYVLVREALSEAFPCR
jgi:hypothetical protein